ncbi:MULTISPECIES: complex I 24 kDa subunit family protein [Paraclostridium]|jgi:NADH:ubiquinone oxidoreductase subunit E|uniref:NADH dehydrogenase n=2 Tax=Paraclostridium TaxID=1849822 RepID=A0A0M3DDD0_9FIRM|nr:MULTISPECIES: NAD(P)H-dependent oxidoreductase subunit E [Paraclostridium]MCU9807413.1 NAD(P)H-dependent oxidoreductase subunit E [Paraclostridium sp. AKS46]MDV8111749.1 NAD(P)H-dependent oxidoreductase subunit E [Bacillus sp. BAU-SS-2023]RDC51098.1 NAD(P)H-dependent oxidoreductase subunit E [Acinetobacter sp. RIT592]EQK45039.1 respiratory-chain NADH dehydrogenase 24 Kd subunit [[Clostridium] bifermentans ATCC 19299] [Paraclostridium bifermentans ATCC 19299]KKY00136.1 NADH dehydrogenase [Pa
MCRCSQCNNDVFEELDEFIDSLPTKKGALIQVLHHAQGLFGYLPKEVQLHIAKKLDVSPAKVYGVVSFYSYFTTEQKGEYKISVCLGTVCFVKGADKILAEFEKQLGIKSGETTSDLMFSLEGLRCVGACGLAPVVVVNGKVYGQVKVDQVKDIIAEYKQIEATC